MTINADDLAVKLGGEVAGAREAIKCQREQMHENRSFSIETTLSGNSPLQLMKSAKKQGYKVMLYYVCTASVELNIDRIASRVVTGGHHVPKDDVERRYRRSLENLDAAARMADVVHMFDNSEKSYRHVLSIHLNRTRLARSKRPVPAWVPTRITERALEKTHGGLDL